MIRKLMATTALVGLVATGAFAQGADPSAPAAPPAAQSPTPMASDAASGAAPNAADLRTLAGGQHLASRMTGQDVYSGDAADAQSIGEIRNLLLHADGRVAAAIVDSTAGDERKTVAVPFEALRWTASGDEMRATLADAGMIRSLPVFTLPEQQNAQPTGNAAVNAPVTGSGGAGAVETTATSSGTPPSAVGADQYLSQTLIGSDVRAGSGEDGQTLGKIGDLVIASSGRVDAAVIGVGGFLGIGSKDVAVPFGELQIARDGETNVRVSMNTTRDALEQAPAFDADSANGTNLAATGAATGAAIGTAAENMRQSAASTADQAGASLRETAENARVATQDAASRAGDAIGEATASARQQLSAAADSAKESLANATDRIESAAANAGTAIENGAERVERSAENAGDRVERSAENATAPVAGAAGTSAAPDATTTASTGSSDRAGLQPVTDASELTADNLLGATVYGPNDESVGDIGDIALNPEGRVDAVIVDVGGFLGIGQKPVAVAMDNVQFMRDTNGRLSLYTQFTQDQLNAAPEFNRDTYAQNRGTMRLESAPDAGGMATSPASGQAN